VLEERTMASLAVLVAYGGGRKKKREVCMRERERTMALLFILVGWFGGEGQTTLIPDGAEVAWLRSRWGEREVKRDGKKGKIMGRRGGFWLTLDPIFTILRP
jgi:hypothetical protein